MYRSFHSLTSIIVRGEIDDRWKEIPGVEVWKYIDGALYTGKKFIIVADDRVLAERLGAAFFTRGSLKRSCI